MAARRGNQEPTRSVVLAYKKTKGKEAVKLYNSTKRKAQTWQRRMIEHILAFGSDGLWVHTKFGYSVPRRNGKNEVVAIREMWGLVNGEKILHTAHRTTTSHSAWERLCNLLDEAGIKYKSIKQFGLERIVTDSGTISFRTRSSKGGLGEGFDLLVIDEAQEYTDDQESALKYVVSDSKNPQTIFCGTPPTTVSAGTVFMKLRDNILQGKTPNGGWAEWSIDEMTEDLFDVEKWYLTNPSLGTILTDRKIRDEIGTDIIDFNIQRLGLWIRYNQKSAISEAEWGRLKVDAVPALNSRLYVGIKYGINGKNVALAIAAKTKDDRVFVEVIDCRPARIGNGWIIDFLQKADVELVEVDGASGQNILAADMKEAKLKPPTLPTVKWVISANAGFEQGLESGKLCHMGQESLAQVAGNCEKRNIGSNGGFGYRAINEDMESALLDSVIYAYYACASAKPKKKQKVYC